MEGGHFWGVGGDVGGRLGVNDEALLLIHPQK